MNCSYYNLSFFVLLLFVTNGVYCKHKERRKKQKESQRKDVHFFNIKPSHMLRHLHMKQEALHTSHHKNNNHQHHGKLHADYYHPAGLKCRRVKFIVNRNLHLKKKATEALKRRVHLKRTGTKLHKKFFSGVHAKRFRLPKEVKLFEDKDGNLATYIEDCVSSEHLSKKNFFESGQEELSIAPAFDDDKNTLQSQSSEDSVVKHGGTSESIENGISEDGILPASEDSLLQSVSDSTEILKTNADKEESQFFNDERGEKEDPSAFAGVFEPETLSNPIPKKAAEEATEMQRYFSSTGLNNLPQFPNSVDISDGRNTAPLGQDVSQGSFENPFKGPDIPQARFIGNADEQGVAHSFSEAFSKLGDAEQEEVENFTNKGLHVPPTLGEAMKVENAEANYEQTFENVYGKGRLTGLAKGAAYLPERKVNPSV